MKNYSDSRKGLGAIKRRHKQNQKRSIASQAKRREWFKEKNSKPIKFMIESTNTALKNYNAVEAAYKANPTAANKQLLSSSYVNTMNYGGLTEGEQNDLRNRWNALFAPVTTPETTPAVTPQITPPVVQTLTPSTTPAAVTPVTSAGMTTAQKLLIVGVLFAAYKMYKSA